MRTVKWVTGLTHARRVRESNGPFVRDDALTFSTSPHPHHARYRSRFPFVFLFLIEKGKTTRACGALIRRMHGNDVLVKGLTTQHTHERL